MTKIFFQVISQELTALDSGGVNLPSRSAPVQR